MTFDVEHHFGAVERSVAVTERDGQPARAVTLARSYDTGVEDLWDALINPERLPRWFLPVEGDLRLGGKYQLKGNAGGTITDCEPPRFLSVTWEFGGGMSWVEVRLASETAEKARLMLTHIAPLNDHWAQYGPGAVGVGWEGALTGMWYYLSAPDVTFTEAGLSGTPDGKAYMKRSSEAWGEAAVAAGEDPSAARTAAARTGAFYTGEALAGG